MTIPADHLVDELVDYFQHGPQSSTRHFLDLPRAAVVEGIPAHRPNHDFVALPERPLIARQLMREFLEAHGEAVSEDASDDELEALVRGTPASFDSFRAESARTRVRKWLDEHGVIYTG